MRRDDNEAQAPAFGFSLKFGGFSKQQAAQGANGIRRVWASGKAY